MSKVNSKVLGNVIGEECSINVNVKGVRSNFAIKELEILFGKNKIILGEKGFEVPVFELDYTYLNVEDLDFSESDGKDMIISFNDEDFIEILNKSKIDFEEASPTTKNDIVEDEKFNNTEPVQVENNPIVLNLQEDISSNKIPLELNKIILNRVFEIEKAIFNENNKTSFKKGVTKVKYSDKYSAATLSIRPSVRNLLDYLCDHSNLNKAEVLELVILNGLKNTDFDG